MKKASFASILSVVTVVTAVANSVYKNTPFAVNFYDQSVPVLSLFAQNPFLSLPSTPSSAMKGTSSAKVIIPPAIESFVWELTGFYQAQNSGEHTFAIDEATKATFQFGSNTIDTEDFDEMVSRKVEQFSPSIRSYMLVKGEYYPLKIVYIAGDQKIPIYVAFDGVKTEIGDTIKSATYDKAAGADTVGNTEKANDDEDVKNATVNIDERVSGETIGQVFETSQALKNNRENTAENVAVGNAKDNSLAENGDTTTESNVEDPPASVSDAGKTAVGNTETGNDPKAKSPETLTVTPASSQKPNTFPTQEKLGEPLRVNLPQTVEVDVENTPKENGVAPETNKFNGIQENGKDDVDVNKISLADPVDVQNTVPEVKDKTANVEKPEKVAVPADSKTVSDPSPGAEAIPNKPEGATAPPVFQAKREIKELPEPAKSATAVYHTTGFHYSVYLAPLDPDAAILLSNYRSLLLIKEGFLDSSFAGLMLPVTKATHIIEMMGHFKPPVDGKYTVFMSKNFVAALQIGAAVEQEEESYVMDPTWQIMDTRLSASGSFDLSADKLYPFRMVVLGSTDNFAWEISQHDPTGKPIDLFTMWLKPVSTATEVEELSPTGTNTASQVQDTSRSTETREIVPASSISASFNESLASGSKDKDLEPQFMDLVPGDKGLDDYLGHDSVSNPGFSSEFLFSASFNFSACITGECVSRVSPHFVYPENSNLDENNNILPLENGAEFSPGNDMNMRLSGEMNLGSYMDGALGDTSVGTLENNLENNLGGSPGAVSSYWKPTSGHEEFPSDILLPESSSPKYDHTPGMVADFKAYFDADFTAAVGEKQTPSFNVDKQSPDPASKQAPTKASTGLDFTTSPSYSVIAGANGGDNTPPKSPANYISSTYEGAGRRTTAGFSFILSFVLLLMV